jgi:UDP-glucose 4-epimerase
VNVAGVGNVLEAARRACVRRVIFSSTSAVYEKTQSERFSESDEIRPDLIYACTKAAAEQLCDAFAVNYGMDIGICRFFNVYGPHQDVTRTSPPFTSYVARELVMNRSPKLFNNSDARRDYVHSDDVVELLTRMMLAEGSLGAERLIPITNSASRTEPYQSDIRQQGNPECRYGLVRALRGSPP